MARRVRFWDLASTGSADADRTAGVKMAREGNRYFIEDVVCGRWTPHDRDQVILQTAHLDGRATEIVVEQEPGSAGVSQIAAMVTLLAGFRISGRRSTGDKVTRAGPLASQMEAGNVKVVSGNWVAAFIDELTSFPSVGVHDDQCLIPGTLVPGIAYDDIINREKYHHKGAPSVTVKPIEQFVKNDRVLTHAGRWQPVTAVMERAYAGEVVSIRPRGMPALELTPEHPVRAVRSYKEVDSTRDGLKRQTPRSGTPEWIAAGELQIGDAVLEAIDQTVIPVELVDMAALLPVAQLEAEGKRSRAGLYLSKLTVDAEKISFANPRSCPVNRFVPVDGRLCRLMGYYVAEGSRGRHNVAWSFHQQEKAYVEDVVALIEALFGVKAGVSMTGRVALVSKSSWVLHSFFGQFGHGAPRKHLPQWVMHLPVEYQRELLSGLWRGDGCATKEGNFVYATSSLALVENVKQLLYRQGIGCCLTISRPNGASGHEINGRVIKAAGPLYCVCVNGHFAERLAEVMGVELNRSVSSVQCGSHVKDGYVWRRVTGIARRLYEGPVFNLSVAEDNSYQTCSFAVHNCDAASSAFLVLAEEPVNPLSGMLVQGAAKGGWFRQR